jgi:hypothetical protein
MPDFTVLQISDITECEGRYPSQMVLRQTNEKTYATHIKVSPPGGEPYFILGRYFFNLDEAETDFQKRAVELNSFR